MSAAVPLHNIFHNHYFIPTDNCGSSCNKHLKNHTKPCCTTSDAVFLGELPQKNTPITLHQKFTVLTFVFKADNYFQFFHLTKNKAPPVIA
ncbi:hypothetical protein A5893_13965 [Pedobacter psychrophilus]|uniref:Uncharacterized protein n=1 Tax=Pedobacter psychrophilus TaxID=1826909 RepID=A0A179DBV1_9SPHI|nr:hypothetical protein [Pedobacter psychrophilus]OAQ38526.1 hypothetical protein A5893_13965 [Pedobacter psychrophilus]